MKIIVWFFPFAVVITLLCGLVYASGQQDLRSGANDPQMQMAEDISIQLSHGATSSAFASSTIVDMAQSLAPFVILYDKNGNVVLSNAQLNGKTPPLPSGVLDMSSWKNPIIGHHLTFWVPENEDRFTWQPQRGVRIAAVLVHYNSGYVLAGRSLREVENREEQLSMRVFLAWVVTMIVTFIAVFIGAFFKQFVKTSRKR